MDDEQKNQASETRVVDSESKPTADVKSARRIPISAAHWQRFKDWYGSNKKWSIPATILLLVILLVLVPWTRYKVAGLVIKKNFTIEVMDATSRTPVSGATISIGSENSQTDGNGRAALHLSSGHHAVSVSKKYYQDRRADVLVPILSQKSTPAIGLTATGRQVKIVVKDLINQKVLSDVDIKIADTTAKTDKNGTAIVVVPPDESTQKATLSMDGYNDSSVTVKVGDSKVLENDFMLTPTGKVYFISKRTGKLDLMKANLDGSGAEVVVAGTGNEHDYDTKLLPSTDWKYVAFVAQRSATDPTPQLYILATADDKLLSVDSGNAIFTLKGWAGDNLIYFVSRNDVQTWQSGKDRLKSYDASSGKTTLLDQSAATGDSSASAYEFYALVTISGNNIIYGKNWTQVYGTTSPSGLIDGKQDTLATISANGQGHKVLANYDANDNVQYAQHSSVGIYIWQQTDPSSDKFFDYTVGSAAPKDINLNSDQFYQNYPQYFVSPSGKQTFWAENRDGKNTLFVGDYTGSNSSNIASLSDYSPYGWFSDDYLLVSKSNSELYIMGTKGGKAIKITDYQQTGYPGEY
ncbi:MAG TPA: hypothetical protein VLE51_03915 [Candidatus Saccharimonadales bacterium]|nr:hypothetical protein [Candidatus Saccharimonadales bacterium]HSX27497.1 hypothetical protein [Patescibacteria group bacterium]